MKKLTNGNVAHIENLATTKCCCTAKQPIENLFVKKLNFIPQKLAITAKLECKEKAHFNF